MEYTQLNLMISTKFVQFLVSVLDSSEIFLVSRSADLNLNTQSETSIVKGINLSCIISVEWILVGGFTLLYTLGMCNTGKDTFISAVGSSSNYGLQLGYVPLFCLFTFRKYVCRGVMIAATSWLFMLCSKLFAIQAVNSKNNTGKDTFISAVGSSSNYGLQLGYVPLFCLFTFRKYVCRGVMIAATSWLFMLCSKLFAIQAVNSKKKKSEWKKFCI